MIFGEFNMNIKKLICAVLVAIIAFSLTGCNQKWIDFKGDEIESLSFELIYLNGTRKLDNEVINPKVIADIYKVLEGISFNKKMPKKDIFDNSVIVYKEPAIHHSLSITLKNGRTKLLYIDSKTKYCYKPGEYRIYSDSGVQLLTIMERYFLVQEQN